MANALLILTACAAAAAWVGHACICTAILNHLYGRPIRKSFLKPFRLVVGLTILAFPLLLLAAFDWGFARDDWQPVNGVLGWLIVGYSAVAFVFGAIIFPTITVKRLLRQPPAARLSETRSTLDVGLELGDKAIGNGKWSWVARLPLNGVFRVDFTELELAPAGLPTAWDGLTILLVSDLHFHGTPSQAFFDRVMGEVQSRWPTPDLVCLAGDYVDTDTHHLWIPPVLQRLTGTEGKFAILGNHDDHHKPDQLREVLTTAGFDVLGNDWRELTIRGERGLLVGHEGPWFAPPPKPTDVPADVFRLCLSHSPDNLYWGARNGIHLMLCGHVHGGQIRLPIIGPIFIPSMFGRRFDCGVFMAGKTLMFANRGLSGKEPLRFRCNPEVVRITLRARPAPGSGAG